MPNPNDEGPAEAVVGLALTVVTTILFFLCSFAFADATCRGVQPPNIFDRERMDR